MCGIAGFIETSTRHDQETLIRHATAMTDRIRYRGPDDSGHWADPRCGVALGHRRLSILDLSPLGHQPMTSASGRYVIVYNGEIYNFREVHAELLAAHPGITFRGTSDTEIMLAAIDHWGLDASLPRFNGMFAFALWDRQERMLHLSRDRIGEKPLYYGWSGDTFLFGSELKPLMAHPSWKGVLNEAALPGYLRFGYISAPQSIFEGIYKVIPGTIVSMGVDRRLHERHYWSPRTQALRALANPFTGSRDEAVEQLEKLLLDAVRIRMEADVPLGAFLSGGIDSSTVVAMMQAQSTQKVKTFSIGFSVPHYNEAEFAKAVANHLGTDHTELYLEPNEGLRLVASLPDTYDEPFADASQIPTMLVAALARKDVTVALSGDGGDELFGGYPRYYRGGRIASVQEGMPHALRAAAAIGLEAVPSPVWALADCFGGQRKCAERVRKIAEILRAPSFDRGYQLMMSQWDPTRLLSAKGDGGWNDEAFLRQKAEPNFDSIHAMMFADLVGYLPDDILTKVDRATMSVSLEGRMPLLDHRVVEFAWSLPLAMKYDPAAPKWALRNVLYRHVPQTMIDRPKMGFGVPVETWIRGELRDWASNLLSPQALRESGLFDSALVQRTLADHLAGRRDAPAQLWSILMFQAWYQRNRESIADAS